MPEANNAEVTATHELTDFEKWEKAPAEVTDTAAAEKTAKVETAAPPEASTETPKTAQELEDEEEEALPKGLKKRFRKLTGKIRDLETQLASKPAAAAPAAEVKPAVATPPVTATDKPKAENFKTYEEYIEALNDWQYDQREAKKTAAATKKTQTEAAATQQKEWIDRVAEAKTRHDDWEDVVDGATDVPMTGAMQQTIIEMERGPDVVYFLASHPEEAKRISKFPPFVQARELGRIEDKLDPLDDEAKPESKKAAVTKAPAPAKIVRGSSANDAGKEPDPKDFAAWSKWADRRDARIAKEAA